MKHGIFVNKAKLISGSTDTQTEVPYNQDNTVVKLQHIWLIMISWTYNID